MSETNMVKRRARETKGTKGTNGTVLNNRHVSGSSNLIELDARGNSKQVSAEDRPCFITHDNPEGSYKKAGLWFHDIKETSDEEPILTDVWICSPIHCIAQTESEDGNNYGLLLRFKTSSSRWAEWAMPFHLLSGNGNELRRELLDRGMRIDPHHKYTLMDWLMSAYPDRQLIAVYNLGWHKECFVLPNCVIGHKPNYIFQHEGAVDHFERAGTLRSWQEELGIYLSGNPLLILAVSAALAGPLLHIIGQQGGGLHLVGDSSTGKSTALSVAASVWGGPTFIRTWRATSNGLEGAATEVNDTLLILDEIGQADPREVGNIVYTIGNGAGKQRATQVGLSRRMARWRVMMLSSGERTLASHMGEDGQRQPKAGQIVRLLDIPVYRRYGIFDTLHDHQDGASLSNCLKDLSSKNYGTLGIAFLEQLVLVVKKRDLRLDLNKILEAQVFQAKDNLHKRAALTFGVCAMAGELAADLGLIPISRGESMHAAGDAFKIWSENQGHGHTEDQQILRNILDFIDKHGASRFAPWEEQSAGLEVAGKSKDVRDRVGWKRANTYLFTPSGLREAIGGHDLPRALKAMEDAGWLAAKDHGKRSKKTKIDGRAINLYWIEPNEDKSDL